MIVLETRRLILREIAAGDAAFIHELLTDRDFRTHIGDRGVATPADAERAIDERYRPAYAELGFGMWLVEGKVEGARLGMAGLVRREGLAHVDVGYAFLPAGRGRGYALEAVRGVLAWAAERGIAPVVAIVNAENLRSIRVLEGAGLVNGGIIRLPGAARDVLLYIPANTGVSRGA